MWKPGQIVTVRGKVCRVKREYKPWHACRQCAFGEEIHCSFPDNLYEKYPLPKDCYLEKVRYKKSAHE